MTTVLGVDVSWAGLVLGVVIGMTYGILAVGLVLIYRSNRIINFAHGEIGAFGATVLALATLRWGLPYWVALPVALAAGAAAGALVEIIVVRRLRHAPKVMSVVGTLGAAQFVLLLSLAVSVTEGRAGTTYPQPPGLPEFRVGALLVTRAYSGMMILTPLVVLGIALFLRHTRFGLGIRGAAANADVARLTGVSPPRMSSLAWAIAGGVSALTAVLVFPTRGFVTAEALGPALLLRALVAAVVARMTSLPVAFLVGIPLGVLEVLVTLNSDSGGAVEVVLFVVILLTLLAQAKRSGREEERGSWTAVQPWKRPPDAYQQVWAIRNSGRIAAAVALVPALLLPVLSTNRVAVIFVSIAALALVGASVGVVTGLAGQLSLGQFAVAGIGATVSYGVARTNGNFGLAFALAGVAGAAVSAVIGLPALRIKGLMLAVTTLSFAVAAQAWLFQQTWMLGQGVDPGLPVIASAVLDTGKEYYLFTLLFLVAGLWLYRNVSRSGVGRTLRALRDNEDAARAFTVPATRRKLQAFALGGFVAGLGGAVYGHSLSLLSFETFAPRISIELVAMTVIGGLGIVSGPLLGALYIIGVPRFVPLDSAGLAATAFGWLLLVLYFPGGLAQLVAPLRARTFDLLAARAGIEVERLPDDGDEERPLLPHLGQSLVTRRRADTRSSAGGALLEIVDVRKRFGGVHAVDGVTLEVRAGETVGVIGPNGAGKTTLFEIVAGFVTCDGGRVVFGGRDVGKLTPEARGRLGLIRSFQDAALFETLTVHETVQVALERVAPTRVASSLLGWSRADSRKHEQARALVSLMGLERYSDKQVNELSTGTRRITEITCLLALEPTLLLLDEPSSGVAQRETEVLGSLLLAVKQQLSCTLVVIEHDMPLIMGMSDRIVAMEAGRVIAQGTPSEIQRSPVVIDSYLGRTAGPVGERRCSGFTRSGAPCSRPPSEGGLCWQHVPVKHRQATSEIPDDISE